VNKECSVCGRPYYRRNLTQVWDQQNPGHRAGWHKTQLRICTACMDPAHSRRLLMLASTTLVTKAPRTRRTLAPVRDIRESRVKVLKRHAS